MKLLLLLAGLFTAPAQAEILKLLDCYIEGAPIPYLTVYSYQGGLWRITTDYEGNTARQRLSPEDFDRRLIPIVEKDDIRGMLFREDGDWKFTFKGPRGWYMSGSAACEE